MVVVAGVVGKTTQAKDIGGRGGGRGSGYAWTKPHGIDMAATRNLFARAPIPSYLELSTKFAHSPLALQRVLGRRSLRCTEGPELGKKPPHFHTAPCVVELACFARNCATARALRHGTAFPGLCAP